MQSFKLSIHIKKGIVKYAPMYPVEGETKFMQTF